MKSFFIVCVFILCVSCGCPHKYHPDRVPDPLPPCYMTEKIRVALVLGSGGVRGMAHVGVIEELLENNIPIDLIVGCSAGSIVGALYADNPHIEAVECAVWEVKSNSILEIDLWNCRYGLSQTKSLHRVLDKHLNAETFEELQVPLVVVASDLNTGELIPIGSGDLVTSVQASCSIPFVFVPCDHMNRILVDGGVVNPVPVKVAYDLGAEVVIAVDLCELLDRTFPKHLFGVATRSAEIAFMWQNEACSRMADIVVRPKTCDVGCFNDDCKLEIYLAGKEAAKRDMPEILALMKEHNIDLQAPTGPRTRLVQLDAYEPRIYLED